MQNYRPRMMPYNTQRQPNCCNNDSMVLAMAYVPWQTWRDIYNVEKALQCGTIFEELNKPFLGKGGIRR